MKKLNQALAFSVIFALLQPRIAYARGGSCGEAMLCTITGIGMGLILLVIFYLQFSSILKKKVL
jgi:hypothetical protein